MHNWTFTFGVKFGFFDSAENILVCAGNNLLNDHNADEYHLY